MDICCFCLLAQINLKSLGEKFKSGKIASSYVGTFPWFSNITDSTINRWFHNDNNCWWHTTNHWWNWISLWAHVVTDPSARHWWRQRDAVTRCIQQHFTPRHWRPAVWTHLLMRGGVTGDKWSPWCSLAQWPGIKAGLSIMTQLWGRLWALSTTHMCMIQPRLLLVWMTACQMALTNLKPSIFYLPQHQNRSRWLHEHYPRCRACMGIHLASWYS